jgi:uncharacterized protein YfdQ (DUF2303 family)
VSDNMIANAIDSIKNLATSGIKPAYLDEEASIPYVVIPQGYKVEGLGGLVYHKFNQHPHRKAQTVTLNTPGSFAGYFADQKQDHSRIFGNVDTAQFTAIIDYHEPGEGPANWCEHRAILTLRHSREWKIWTAASGKKMSQVEMAEFLEDNSIDIVNPSGAAMLEIASTLQARSEVAFESATRLQDGQTQFTYREEIKGTAGAGKMSVPDSFTIKVSVFDGMPPVEIVARLRYRISSSKLVIWFDLLRADRMRDTAFQEVADYIVETCGPLYMGSV